MYFQPSSRALASNFRLYQTHLGHVLKYRLLVPAPRGSHTLDLGQSLRIYIMHGFSDGADADGPGPALCKPLLQSVPKLYPQK